MSKVYYVKVDSIDVDRIEKKVAVGLTRETRNDLERFGGADVVVLDRGGAGYAEYVELIQLKEEKVEPKKTKGTIKEE